MKNQQRHDEYDFENDDNDDGDNDETDIWFYNVPFGQFFTFAISFAPTLSHDDCVCAYACVCVCSTTSCVIFLLRRINSNANAVVVFKKPFPCVGLGTHVYLRWVLTVKQKCVEHEHEQLIGTHAYTCDCNLVNAIWMNVAKYLAISKTYATWMSFSNFALWCGESASNAETAYRCTWHDFCIKNSSKFQWKISQLRRPFLVFSMRSECI